MATDTDQQAAIRVIHRCPKCKSVCGVSPIMPSICLHDNTRRVPEQLLGSCESGGHRFGLTGFEGTLVQYTCHDCDKKEVHPITEEF